MPHVLGTFLQDWKPVRYALHRFKGIGHAKAWKICAVLGFHETLKMGEMTEGQLNALANHLGEMKLDNEVTRKVRDNIARLRRIGSFRGRRHASGYPVRGQHTQTNAKTARKLNRLERAYHTATIPRYCFLGNGGADFRRLNGVAPQVNAWKAILGGFPRLMR